MASNWNPHHSLRALEEVRGSSFIKLLCKHLHGEIFLRSETSGPSYDFDYEVLNVSSGRRAYFEVKCAPMERLKRMLIHAAERMSNTKVNFIVGVSSTDNAFLWINRSKWERGQEVDSSQNRGFERLIKEVDIHLGFE